jgi:cysteine desulfurase / selenocysteine lyase
LYLDGTQSVGALQFDCRTIDPDFLAVDAYKWMISPNGAGFLYVRPEVRTWLKPQVVGWRSDREWRSVESLHLGEPRYSDDAERYEGGQLAFPCLAALRESVAFIRGIGPDVIEERVLQLCALLRDDLRSIGADEFPPQRTVLPSQVLLMRLPGVSSSGLARKLWEQKIHISARREYLRISPHFYNNEEDIAALVGAIKRLTRP